MSDILVTVNPSPVISVTVNPAPVFTSVIAVGQGPAGPVGPMGPSGVTNASYLSSSNLSGHRLVTIDNSGSIIYASNDNNLHANRVIGMTTGASSSGAMSTVQANGELLEPSWNWDTSLPVYLGLNGLLTQTPPVYPSALFSLIVGFPVSTTTLYIQIGQPIALTL
jgi:hypothetical protein